MSTFLDVKKVHVASKEKSRLGFWFAMMMAAGKEIGGQFQGMRCKLVYKESLLGEFLSSLVRNRTELRATGV